MNYRMAKVVPAVSSMKRESNETRLAQVCRGMLLRLNWPENRGLKTLGLIAKSSGDGVTTVVEQLGLAAADFPEQRILLVDANWYDAQLTRKLCATGKTGLRDYFFADATVEDIVFPTLTDNLFVAAVGVRSGSLHEVDRAKWRLLLDAFVDSFDLILVDLPSLDQTNSQLTLAAQLDETIGVFHGRRTTDVQVRQTRKILGDCRVKLAGVILNEGAR